MSPQLPLLSKISFDFRLHDTDGELVKNLSGIVMSGDIAWTVSDEGRTFERFEKTRSGFVLTDQFRIDDYFPDLPRGEADLEAIDVADGRLWLCGSHSRVRREVGDGALNPSFRRRPSRHLFGSIRLSPMKRPQMDRARAMPFRKDGSLRQILRSDPFLSAFMNVPSKENGLDIEGLAVFDETFLYGLRGPVIDNHAIMVSLRRNGSLPENHRRPELQFFDLGGLGIRDLCRMGDDLLILSGPVTSASGPFRIYHWARKDAEQPLTLIHEWEPDDEHPEGLTVIDDDGRHGLIVVYDGPSKARRVGPGVVMADWFSLEPSSWAIVRPGIFERYAVGDAGP